MKKRPGGFESTPHLFNPLSSAAEDLARLEGQVERVTYTNEETGYTVAKVRTQAALEPVTIVGDLLALTPGEVLVMKGTWKRHPKFGDQFRVSSHRTVLPASISGIKKYLGSGLIKGIGPVMASRIVKVFGDKTLDVIDKEIEKLASVEGLGRKRIKMIQKAWEDQKEIQGVMIFLHEHGVGPAHAAKIYKKYGQRASAVITRNPYCLARDISGIGFQTADRIAAQLGFDKSAPLRVEAGILYVLDQLSEEGHVCYPYDKLVETCEARLEVDRDTVEKALSALVHEKQVVVEAVDETLHGYGRALYRAPLYVCETGVAGHLTRLTASGKGLRTIDVERAIHWVQRQSNLRLAPGQVKAVRRAVSEKVSIITGGPGTGKTTIIHAVLQIYRAMKARVFLAAPTGRASKRMTEATGHPAATIHRMLEYRWQKGAFSRNETRPLEADVVIVDEASMIDVTLMYHLLKAMPSQAVLILVGDANQLPSVGAGDVLKELIDSGTLEVTELTEIFRQARKSMIVVNAHRINQGTLPEAGDYGDSPGDFYFIDQEEPQQVLQIILELVSKRIPSRFHLDPVSDIQVLSPMHKGTVGTENLNQRLQETLNPSPVGLVRGTRRFRLHDKVMQVRNNYEKEVFNGDIGEVASIDGEKQEMVVNFDGRHVTYDAPDLDEITLAYAISVHKSQGSEYPAVVVPILAQHYLLLQRNLIYTAVTRGKRLVVMVGSRRAMAAGVKNDKVMRRYTGLSRRLKAL